MTSRAPNSLVLIVLAIALISFGIGILSFIQMSTFLNRAIRVRADVMEAAQEGGRNYVTLTFVDLNTKRYTVDSIPNSYLSPIKAGDKIRVFVDPNQPASRVVYDRFTTKWLEPLIFIIFGLVPGIFAAKLLFDRRKPEVKHPETQTPSPKQEARKQSEPPHAPQPPIAPQPAKPRQQDGIFGPLQAHINEKSITDIIVAGPDKVTIVRNGRTLPAEVKFSSQEDLRTYVEHLLNRAGVSYSTAKPIVDGVIGPEIRIHAVHPVLCDNGPYLAIRVSRFSSIEVGDLNRFELAPKAVLNYLKEMVGSGQTILVAGSVGTGKTTLIRALASDISHDESILVIEDTPEVKIDHPNVRYLRTREANVAGVGYIPLSECIRAGMRMAMDRIILGEIRDALAAEAFIDVCVSGHPGLSTIHARSAHDALNRLELFLGRQQVGVNRDILREEVFTALQCVVYLKICPLTGKRRIFEVHEVGLSKDGKLLQKEIFQYRLFEGVPGWNLMSSESLFDSELQERKVRPPLEGLKPVFGLES